MNVPLLVDTERLQMLDKSAWDLACAVCDKRQSKWELVSPAEKPGTTDTRAPICSLCFLYESAWGKARAEHLQEFLKEVAAENTERKMLLGPNGGLVSIRDADHILGILALTSRRFAIEDLKAGGDTQGRVR